MNRLERQRNVGSEGFTLIETLIVLVIMPILLGAVALAMITTFKNDTATLGRLSDSLNAQIGSAFFGRDVQGAAAVTKNGLMAVGYQLSSTNQQIAKPFASAAPEACGPQSVLSAVTSLPADETLLVAFYRSAQSSVAATDVAYWLEGNGSSAQITRYSCTLTSTYTATNPTSAVIADIPNSPNAGNVALSTTAITAATTIAPSQIDSFAQSVWAPINPSTVYQGSTATLPTSTLTVPSTSGFTSGWLTIITSLGPQAVDCTGVLLSTAFQSCTGGSGTISLGDTVTQSSISNVQTVITEPTTSYRYTLSGMPQSAANNTTTCIGGTCPSPALLVLGNGGITLTGTGSSKCSYDSNNKDKLCVNGTVALDGGVATCNGQAQIGSTGSIESIVGPTGSTCNPTQIVQSGVISDPLQGHTPSPCAFPTLSTNPPTHAGNYVPGIYTSPISGATLEPGLYVLEGGISGNLSLATYSASDTYFNNDPTAGVLLYLPGNGYTGSSCLNVTNTNPSLCPAITTGSAFECTYLTDPNKQVALAPLDSTQAETLFNDPYMADVWYWQDITNTSPLTMNGNVTVSSAGLMYLPGATLVNSSGSPSITTGRMIVGGVSLTGTPSITITGS